MADGEEDYLVDDEVVEIKLRRRRAWIIAVGVLIVAAVGGWTWWESRPALTELTIQVRAFRDEARTRPTSEFDVVINGEATPSDLGEDGARIVQTRYLRGTEIAIAVRSSQNDGATTQPRYHTVDPRALTKLDGNRRGIEEVFVLGESGGQREVRVRVVDDSGRALSGIPIHADDRFVGVTREDGYFSFMVGPTERTRVAPVKPNQLFLPTEAVSEADKPGVIVFALERPVASRELVPLTVQVLDETGAPLAGVPIVVDGSPRASTQSDGRAVFQISSGSLVRVEPQGRGVVFSPSMQMAGPGTNLLPPFVRVHGTASRAGEEAPPAASSIVEPPLGDPPVRDVSEAVPAEAPITTSATDGSVGSDVAAAPATSDLAASQRTADTPAAEAKPPVQLVEPPRETATTAAPSDTQDGSAGSQTSAPAAPSRPAVTPPPERPVPRETKPPVASRPSTEVRNFAGDYVAAEAFAKERPGDEARLQFDPPASAAQHEPYGRLLWLRARGLEREGRLEEAIRDYHASYEYRPSATTVIDLLAAEYGAHPCGDAALLDEAVRQATRQSISAASREKLRAFAVFTYNCQLASSTDPDASSLLKARLCEALEDYFDGVDRGGERRYFADIETIRNRASCAK